MSDPNQHDAMRERLALRKRQIALARAKASTQAVPQASTQTSMQASAPGPQTARAGAAPEPIAIVGLSGYLPAAMHVADFWRYLDQDRAVISEIPADRFDWRQHYDPTGRDPAKMRTRWGAFIPDIRGFDRELFGVLPDEADLLDPQLRLLLMSVYQTIEDAGHAPGSLKKSRTGVYVAAEDNEYLQHLIRAGVDLGVNGLNHHPSMLANRVSYFFDLRGPSEIVNTMCASAAVALHRAVMAIRSGEVERAIVGAVRVIVRPEPFIGLSRMKVLSAGDSVRSFGRDADGYIRAEGVASVLLEPLSRARAGGRRVYALIRSSAVNYNGQGGMSIAAPNVEAHVDVIRQCYEQAGVDPRDIAYIEAQGMGNQVGDIAEWEACNRALAQMCAARGHGFEPGFCRISTLKPMLGHMECTSALGALFKIIRSFHTDRVHAILGLDDINPYLELAGRPCRLVQQTEPWPRAGRPRLAGLHSYGSGGNNAHLLVEECPGGYPGDHPAETLDRPAHPFNLQPCWIDAAPQHAASAPQHAASAPQHAASAPQHAASAPQHAASAPRPTEPIPQPVAAPQPAPGRARSKRICVIGAGPSGLVMAKSLLEEGHQPVVFEQQRALGGLWLLNRHKTAGAYQKTRFQSSKFTSVFSDFYTDDIASTFYSVDDVITYLRRYTEAFGLTEHIHFDSEVVSVREHQGRWDVAVRRNGTVTRETFDGVALCQGSFWHPYTPHKPGIERFQGEILHSGAYFDNARFRGKRVLVIGGGVSAMDIAEEAAEVAAAVYWSRRTNKLILPRMVGFVPNDCQSPASLLVAENRYNIIERLRRSMPDYFARYEQSGILPSAEEFRNNPVVHINDAMVGLVAAGKVVATGDVTRFDEGGCFFAGAAAARADIDVVVFATGYKNFGAEDTRYAFLDDISVARDFAMGIFHAHNPTLVNTAVLPIAFTGSFYFSEMVARWYAQLLSGACALTDAERAHRITDVHYLIMAPVSSVLFGLRLGLFPRPETEFRAFWRLLNYPAFPMIHRLRGPHAMADAAERLERFRQLAYVKTDESDPALRVLKERILAGLDTLDELLRAGEITQDEYEGALRQRHDPLVLDWEAQYIKRARALADAPVEALPAAPPTAPADHLADRPADPPADCPAEPPAGQPDARSMDDSLLIEPLTAALARIMARILRIDPAAVAPGRNLSEYGFDSIALTGFASDIAQRFDFVRLDPSTFLEHATLASLARFLARKHPGSFARHFGIVPASPPPREAMPAPVPVARPATRLPAGDVPAGDEIAVIGMGGRFPGAASVADFWHGLVHGRSAITEVPGERWSWQEHWGDPRHDASKTDCIHGAFLDGIDRFDPRHFHISPREAVYMDPQHRMMLEVAWETMENAAYTRAQLCDRKVGLFIGVEKQDYLELIIKAGLPLDGHMNPGNAHSMLANRISRFFSWRGPSLVTDTACAGAFTALHLACDQLRQGHIELAFAGGVNVLLTPSLFILNRQLGMLTNEPVVRPFDRKAAGHLGGEAAALVMLKPLTAAIRDRDTIHGVIRSVAIQHGGRGVHLMAPNPASHREVIEDALASAGLDARDIDYIEAQGTGNPLTDRMELATYQRVFSALPPGTLRLGTIKGNVGHLGAASGAVALIKTILCLRNRTLPGIANLEEPSWDEADGPLPVRPLTRSEGWDQPRVDGQPVPRRAGIHNYGFGGVNAHAIVEEYPATDAPAEQGAASAGEHAGDHVIVLSARTDAQLTALAARLGDYLAREDYQAWGFAALTLEAIAYTLQCGREAWPHRLAIVASSVPELAARLAAHVQAVQAEQGEGNGAGGAATDRVHRGAVDDATMRHWQILLDEDERRLIVRNAVAQRNMTRLALLWVQGVDVPWDELYQGRAVPRVPLPTYPFARERYWAVEDHASDSPVAAEPPGQSGQSGEPGQPGQPDHLTSAVIAALGQVCGIPQHELTPATPLTSLGIDSLLMTQLVDYLGREHDTRPTTAELQQCRTVGDLARLFRIRDTRPARATPAMPPGLEVVQRGAGLPPAFWFHGAFGTIQQYIPLARRIGAALPFHAIPARGVRDHDPPLDNIVAMASHYRALIHASGWRGPFQLGGYSQGGVLAYEVARQLQEEGHTVANLVLVDAPFPPVISSLTRRYHLVLTFLNILGMSGLAQADDLARFIARPERGLVAHLVDEGLRRGLKYAPAELTAVIHKYAAITEANIAAMGAYQPMPLPRAGEIECHYIARRDPGTFFPGHLTQASQASQASQAKKKTTTKASQAKKTTTRTKTAALRALAEQDRFYARQQCVRQWRAWLPRLTVHRTDAPDHFALMTDHGSLDIIAAVCRRLYRVEA